MLLHSLFYLFTLLLFNFSQVDAVVLLDFVHDEGTLNGAEAVYFTQFVEHKFLILLHVLRANL